VDVIALRQKAAGAFSLPPVSQNNKLIKIKNSPKLKTNTNLLIWKI
jgi:hypothetical protein